MKPNLILLHGALGSASQFHDLKLWLEPQFRLLDFNFSGHGGKPFPVGRFSIDGFTTEIVQFMQETGLECSAFFGYSMGGYVALNLAAKHPEKVSTIFTLATKFDWTPESAQKEIRQLNPEKIKEKIPAFAQLLEKRHQPNRWEDLVEKTAQLLYDLGETPPLSEEILKQIQMPVCIGIGEEDSMVTIRESENAAKLLPNGTLKRFAGFKHPLEQTDAQVLAETIRAFMA